MDDDKYTFMGWWEENDKYDVPEPWEEWRVHLYGMEAGDRVDTVEDIDRVLEASGYELILRKKEGE